MSVYASIGFWMGLVSLGLWILLAIPQIIENVKNKRADGISIYFLLLWLIGDICNLVGSLLSDATTWMKIIAAYFIIYDTVLLSQLFYYGYHIYRGLHNERQRRHNWTDWFLVAFLIYLFCSHGADAAPITSEGHSLETTGLHATTEAPSTTGFWEQVFVDTEQTIGFSLGVVAGLCYVVSRIPQIRLNATRKSCKGVSVLMFYILFSAVVTYIASVLLESMGWVYIVQKSPWLISYALCAFLDAFIIGQYYFYGTGENEGIRQVTRV